ncbi:MAG: TMEM14 family protein [Fimbriimonadaceae bacterium]
MTWLKAVLVFYALFLGFAGLQAYLGPKQSVPSLLGGVGAAVVLLISVALIGWRPIVGYLVALVVSLAMIGRFLPAFLKADNPAEAVWPHLAVSVVSALVAVALVLGHFMSKRQA